MKTMPALLLLVLFLLAAGLTACTPGSPAPLPAPDTPSPAAPALEASPEPTLPEAECPQTSLNVVGWMPDGVRQVLLTHTYSEQGVQSALHLLNIERRRAELSLEAGLPVVKAALAPDGTRLALGLDDSGLQLISLPDGQPLGINDAHTAMISALIFSPDSQRLYSGSHDGTVKIWDRDWNPVIDFTPTVIDGFPREIVGMGISPDGKLLAVIPNEGWISVWDLDSLEQVGEFRGSIMGGYDGSLASFSYEGDFLAASLGGGGDISVWDVRSGDALWSMPGMAAVFSPAEDILATSDFDQEGGLKLRSAENWQEPTVAARGLGFVTSLVFSQDGSRLSAADGAQVRTWNLTSGGTVSNVRVVCLGGQNVLQFDER
jgi:WD40 repeat protein